MKKAKQKIKLEPCSERFIKTFSLEQDSIDKLEFLSKKYNKPKSTIIMEMIDRTE